MRKGRKTFPTVSGELKDGNEAHRAAKTQCLCMLFQRQFPNLVPWCLPKSLASVSHFSLQYLQSVLVQEPLHVLLKWRWNVGLWHPAIWLSSAWIFLCLPSFTFKLLYVSHSRYFDSQILCWSYGWVFQSCKLLFIQIVGTIAIWQLWPAEGLCFSTWDHSSTHFPYSSDQGDASGNLSLQ